MTEMRVLTVRQPWAWAIIRGGKTVENRSRNLAGTYRGPVAIHVSLRDDVNAFATSSSAAALNDAADRLRADRPSDYWRHQGRIIGVVDLIGSHPALGINGGEINRCGFFGMCSEWAEPEMHHLELARPRALAQPFPYRGALGLRTLPTEIAARVLAEVKA